MPGFILIESDERHSRTITLAGGRQKIALALTPDVAANAQKVNEQLDLLWIGAGTDDFAMAGAKRMAEFLTASKIKHTFRTTGGEHTSIA